MYQSYNCKFIHTRDPFPLLEIPYSLRYMCIAFDSVPSIKSDIKEPRVTLIPMISRKYYPWPDVEMFNRFYDKISMDLFYSMKGDFHGFAPLDYCFSRINAS